MWFNPVGIPSFSPGSRCQPLPWVRVSIFPTQLWRSCNHPCRRQPFQGRKNKVCCRRPRVVRHGGQPWAEGLNPIGIRRLRFHFEYGIITRLFPSRPHPCPLPKRERVTTYFHLRVIHTTNHSDTATAVVAMRRVRRLKRVDQGSHGTAVNGMASMT